ncbi:MAG: hypothetical protein K2X48_13495 [Chitinophagaceae bacterium]|nr:hypothetical protein [Chitinophagaceae bacterium]
MQLEQGVDIHNSSFILGINHSVPSAHLKNINGTSLTYITPEFIPHLYFKKQ